MTGVPSQERFPKKSSRQSDEPLQLQVSYSNRCALLQSFLVQISLQITQTPEGVSNLTDLAIEDSGHLVPGSH